MSDRPKPEDKTSAPGTSDQMRDAQVAALNQWLRDGGYSKQISGGSETEHLDIQKRRSILTRDTKICVRCHPENNDSKLPPLDFSFFKERPQAPTAEELRAREVDTYNKEDTLGKAVHLLSRLPNNFDLQFDGGKVAIRTDFSKLAETIPNVQLPDVPRDLMSSMRRVTLDKNHVAIDIKKEIELPLSQPEPLVGKTLDLRFGDKLDEVSFDVDFERGGKRVKLQNIDGLSLKLTGGQSVNIRELNVDASSSTPVISIGFENPKQAPALTPEYLKKVWPKVIATSMPLDKLSPGITSESIHSAIELLRDVKTISQSRDLKGTFTSLPDRRIGDALQMLLGDVQSITKAHDKIELTRRGDEKKFELGDKTELLVGPKLSLKATSNIDEARLSSISGITFSAPIPTELGIGNRLTSSLQELSIGRDYGYGQRVEAHTDNLIDSVRFSLDKNFKPRLDELGNWHVDTTLKNPYVTGASAAKLDLNLRIGPNGNIVNPPSDFLDFYSRASWQATNFSGRGAKMMLNTMWSGLASDAMWIVGK